MLIVINIAILIILTFVNFALRLNDSPANAANWLDLPAGSYFLSRPWTLLTYMFTQTDVMHAIFNMLWLYWFGRMYQDISSPRKLVSLYLIAGFSGGIAYIVGSLLWPAVSGVGLEGASAAVMGVVTATAILIPNYKLRMFFLGDVKLKWIAIATIALFALGLTGSNAGAHIAHFGGIGAGAVIVLRPRLFKRPFRSTKTLPASISEVDARRELDILLDKVRRSGYGSLTSAERRRLFELSHQV